MKTAAVESWLRKQTFLEAFLNVPVGLICLTASFVALAILTAIAFVIGLIIFGIIATILKSTFDYNFHNNSLVSAIFCASFLFWLFVSHYRRNVEYLRYAKYQTPKVHVSDAGLGRTLNILLAGPHGEDGIFKQVFYAGPQWFVSAFSMFYKSVTLLRMNIPSCAKILVALFEKGSRVSLTDLAKIVPDCNAPKVFPQLRDIAGVIFLQTEPSGISITSDLRAELARVLGVKLRSQPDPKFYRQTQAGPPPPLPKPLVEEEPPGPHRILGVSRSASIAEIKAAYRKQIKQCHPDRFATLNKDWQKMAEQRAKAVNAAYKKMTEQAIHRRANA